MTEKFDPFDPSPKFDNLVTEVQRGKDAIKLLHDIWLAKGAYGGREIPRVMWGKVNDFFGFDDSE